MDAAKTGESPPPTASSATPTTLFSGKAGARIRNGPGVTTGDGPVAQNLPKQQAVRMTAFSHICLAEIPTTWIPGLMVGLILYLLWAYFRPTLQQRKDERERRRRRLSHWGHE